MALAVRVRPAGVLLVAGIAIATAWTVAHQVPGPDTDWPAHARCIGGPVACRVPIVPDEWSVEWTGDPATYAPPTRAGF